MKYCSKCGAELNGRFCSNCGSDSQKEKKKIKIPKFVYSVLDFVKKYKKQCIIGSVVFLCVLVTSIVLISRATNIFRVAKVAKIEIGMSHDEVRDILGDPNDEEKDKRWYYYEDSFAELYQEAEESLEDAFLGDGDLGAAEEVYNELMELEYKFIMVSFSDGKVTEVFLDCNHMYDEDDDYLTAVEKELKKLKTDIEYVSVYEIVDGNGNSHSPANIVTPTSVSFEYSAEFENGVYIKAEARHANVEINDEKTVAKLSWDDDFNEYNTNLLLNVTAQVNEAYELVKWCYDGEVAEIPEGIISISAGAFPYSAKNVKEIILPESIVSFENISKNTFSNCSSLEYNVFEGADYLGTKYNPYKLLIKANSDATSVSVHSDCVAIAQKAFSNSKSLTNITLSDSVTSIGERAFENCTSLTSVTIGNSVTSIGEWAFSGCDRLTSVSIPDSVTSIGDDAFYNCDSLTSVTIGNNVTSIGNSAFYGCEKLVEVINKSSLDIEEGRYGNLGYYALEVHSGNSKIVNKDNYLFYTYNGTNYLVGYVGNDTSLTLPSSYDGQNYEIYKYAFRGCTSLTSVTIGDSVTSIPYKAFSYCDSLTSVTIPNSVTSIGQEAFFGCTSLTSVTIPNSVTSIGIYAFRDCDSLTSVTIGDSVTTIGDSAFEDCASLTSVTIGNSVTSIGSEAFFGCTSLTSVTIPNSVTSIGIYAFRDCDSLTSATIPNSVTSIGNFAFRDCNRLTSITVDLDNGVYKSIDGNLYTKDGKTLIQYAIGKQDTSFTIPNSVTSIAGSAFSDCYKLTSVVIPDSVTNIGDLAFSDCPNLTIYCEAESEPGWSSFWNDSKCPVVWGYK